MIIRLLVWYSLSPTGLLPLLPRSGDTLTGWGAWAFPTLRTLPMSHRLRMQSHVSSDGRIGNVWHKNAHIGSYQKFVLPCDQRLLLGKRVGNVVRVGWSFLGPSLPALKGKQLLSFVGYLQEQMLAGIASEVFICCRLFCLRRFVYEIPAKGNGPPFL